MESNITLEELTLRTSKGNIKFYCPSLYLSGENNTISFNQYKNSKIIYDPYWDIVKPYFVKYSRYYGDFSFYIFDIKAFATFYSQMTYTSRAVYNIPGFTVDTNKPETDIKQALDYLILLQVRLPDISTIHEKIQTMYVKNYTETYRPSLIDASEDCKPDEYVKDNSETEIWAPEGYQITETKESRILNYDSLTAINNDIKDLHQAANRYNTLIDSLFVNAIGTKQGDVKVQMLKMIGDTLASYMKEIDVVADKINEDIEPCQN